MRSMTGYGRYCVAENDQELYIELKSVNHRYLDMSFRIPKVMQFAELALRKAIGSDLSRGHIDISLTYQDLAPQARQVEINTNLAVSYVKAAKQLKKTIGLKNTLKLADILNMPEIVLISQKPQDEVLLMQLCMKTLAPALAALLLSREQEGEAMRSDLSNYLNSLEDRQTQLAVLVPTQPLDFQQRLSQRLEQLAPQGVDAARLAQEVALFADRVAMDEELARLAAHISQMQELLHAREPVGRKMDFLSQEMNREINTIGSKSSSLQITRLVLDMKNILEKVREQIQNVE